MTYKIQHVKSVNSQKLPAHIFDTYMYKYFSAINTSKTIVPTQTTNIISVWRNDEIIQM